MELFDSDSSESRSFEVDMGVVVETVNQIEDSGSNR